MAAHGARTAVAGDGHISVLMNGAATETAPLADDVVSYDNCMVPLDRRGPKPRPDECDDGANTRSHK
jgi:hypothetical protein